MLRVRFTNKLIQNFETTIITQLIKFTAQFTRDSRLNKMVIKKIFYPDLKLSTCNVSSGIHYTVTRSNTY